MGKISLFKNSFADEPLESLDFEEFIKRIKNGHWSKIVSSLRGKGKDDKSYKRLKSNLPAVTMSGEYKTRDRQTDVKERLKKHSGLIALDIDKKDNFKLRTQDLVDNQCLAQFVSCGGEGIKIIYLCTPTQDAAVHRRIYDAAVKRLEDKGIKIKVDPIVKSIASLQYVSYDPDAFYFPKSKLVIKPLAAVKVKKRAITEDIASELEQLNSYIDALGEEDVTKEYEDWMNVAFGLSYSLGEHGREIFHKLSKNYAGYSESETDEKYDACLERDASSIERPVTVSSVYQLMIDALPKVQLKHLAKKYSKSHAVGVGEDVEQGDLAGMVRYKLFLFKKIFDKETNTLIELLPQGINLNEFERLLREKRYYRFGDTYIHIIDNIVETVDADDILRDMTKHVEGDGDYKFTYKKLEFYFSWEELVHLWRQVRAQGTTYNQIASSLEHWQPNLLQDTAVDSFVPYRNGVVHVNKKQIKLIPYDQLKQQIWKERILPRDFKYTEKKGMFEDFFANVCGRGEQYKDRIKSPMYKRSLWYYGYMLQGSKRQSTARAWLLYDIKTGNNGRSGKTIIGSAVGKIRSVVTLDGKQIDFKNRFAFQTVLPWTDVVFIDDPSKFMSIVPLFNMISGELNADKKGTDPIVKSVKFMIASNWILEAEGNSEIGRQFVTQLDDFYVRYSKEHKNTITPIVDLHGKEFFTDWDDNDWNQFDSFSMRALQTHLKEEAPSNTIIGNALLVRFIQLYEHELFYELANVFASNVKKSKEGGLLISQQLLIQAIKDHDVRQGSVKAGRVAREFLLAIGAKGIGITSMVIANMNRMAYSIEEDFEELNFGEFTKKITKPKF